MEIKFLETSFNTHYYKEACQLRDDILRKPLGMSLYDQNLEEEKDYIHIIAKSSNDEVIAYLQFRLLDDNTAKMQQVAVRKKKPDQWHWKKTRKPFGTIYKKYWSKIHCSSCKRACDWIL